MACEVGRAERDCDRTLAELERAVAELERAVAELREVSAARLAHAVGLGGGGGRA